MAASLLASVLAQLVGHVPDPAGPVRHLESQRGEQLFGRRIVILDIDEGSQTQRDKLAREAQNALSGVTLASVTLRSEQDAHSSVPKKVN